MAADRERKNDGAWHALNPAIGQERGVRFPREIERQTIHYTRRGFRGKVARVNADVRGGWEYESCGHVHTKQSAARVCAERLARHLNRTAAAS